MSSNKELREELIDRICAIMREIVTPLEGRTQQDIPDDVKESIDRLTEYKKFRKFSFDAWIILISFAGIFKPSKLT